MREGRQILRATDFRPVTHWERFRFRGSDRFRPTPIKSRPSRRVVAHCRRAPQARGRQFGGRRAAATGERRALVARLGVDSSKQKLSRAKHKAHELELRGLSREPSEALRRLRRLRRLRPLKGLAERPLSESINVEIANRLALSQWAIKWPPPSESRTRAREALESHAVAIVVGRFI